MGVMKDAIDVAQILRGLRLGHYDAIKAGQNSADREVVGCPRGGQRVDAYRNGGSPGVLADQFLHQFTGMGLARDGNGVLEVEHHLVGA
jgi:hypothetical protein